MASESIVAAFFGIAAAYRVKKPSPIEPFVKTFQLANEEHAKAVENLNNAARELVRVYIEKENDHDRET